MPSSTSPAAEVLTRPQRIVFGLLLLLVVDVIWVASAEFTEYIFHDLKVRLFEVEIDLWWQYIS